MKKNVRWSCEYLKGKFIFFKKKIDSIKIGELERTGGTSERRGASIPFTCRGGRRVDTSRGGSVNSSASTPCGIENIEFSKRRGACIPFACRGDHCMDTNRGESVISSASTSSVIKNIEIVFSPINSMITAFATGLRGSAELSDWMAMNNLIQSWIFNTLEQSLALQGNKIEKCHTGTGIPVPYPGPWRVRSGSKIVYPGGYGSGSGSGSKFHYKGTGPSLRVP
ncbi:hypothetical protein M9H77_17421 [Catharanthus roseus]|uniref:Uncharacterized protein n=1 Tax=Catharanthus roseus TaxID=4058 RepID=A0ACC0B4X9_CATRO|nr:hypothetical protein M9H77_17421 [Catharanthus roseus]